MTSRWMRVLSLLAVTAAAVTSCSQSARPRAPSHRPAAGRGAVGGDGGVWLSERRTPRVPADAPDDWSDPADASASERRIGPPPIDRPDPYRIKSDDVLVISVLGEEEMTREIRVGPDGRINYYIANGVEAAGRTFAEIRAEITRRLRAHFKNPQVSVAGKSYSGNTVSILGVVGHPGRYEVRSDTRLLDVLAEAGGIPISWRLGANAVGAEDVADLEHAYLLRGDSFVDADFTALFGRNEALVAKNNVLVKPDDRIFVPASVGSEQRVIVLGEVRRPGVVRYSKSISFLEAVAETGGVKPSAWERRSFIVRGRLSSPTVIPLSVRLVMVGRARDVKLQAGDIVLVPKHALGKIEEITRQIVPLLGAVRDVDALGE